MFDINILPINLQEGRNLGELPGLKIYSAPKRCDKTRLNDVVIVLMTAEKINPSIQNYNEWGKLISDSYYTSKGSFTMGITAAVRALGTYLDKQYPGLTFPVFKLNLAVIRDKTLLVTHAGTVSSTVIYSNHVDNYYDESSLPVNAPGQGLRFFQTELHPGDMVLMCSTVPTGWTNEAILDATSESPMDVLRYLFDQAKGNLRSAVIQVKAGRGTIAYRYKPPVTTNVDLGYNEKENEQIPATMPRSATPEISGRIRDEQRDGRLVDSNESGLLIGSDAEEPRPLFRLRVPKEPTSGYLFFQDELKEAEEIPSAKENPEVVKVDPAANKIPEEEEAIVEEDSPSNEIDAEVAVDADSENALDKPSPDAEVEPQDIVDSAFGEFDLLPQVESKPLEAIGDSLPDQTGVEPLPSLQEDREPPDEKPEQSQDFGKRAKRALLLTACAVLIPVIVAVSIFLVYNRRGRNAYYTTYLQNAVDTAQVALDQTEPLLQVVSWEKVIEYLDEAERYGSSPASTALRETAYETLDSLASGKQTQYQYALAEPLPAGTKLIDFESSSQFIYGLDENTGGIIRFSSGGRGLSPDNTYSCNPGETEMIGTSTSENQTDTVNVGKLVDFVLLPTGAPLGQTAGIDHNGNVLYCNGTICTADILATPDTGRLEVQAVAFNNSRLYVLDTVNSKVWYYDYSSSNGFNGEAHDYFGSGGPGLVGVSDIQLYEEDSFFLRNNGTLIHCDYTGYVAECENILTIGSNDRVQLDLANMNITKMKLNKSPDISLYLMDEKMQTTMNLSLKMNLIRYITPERRNSEGAGKRVTALGFADNFNLLWASDGEIYSGLIP